MAHNNDNDNRNSNMSRFVSSAKLEASNLKEMGVVTTIHRSQK